MNSRTVVGRILVIVGVLISAYGFSVFLYDAGWLIFVFPLFILVPIILTFRSQSTASKLKFPKYVLISFLGISLIFLANFAGHPANIFVAIGIVVCGILGIFFKPIEKYVNIIIVLGCLIYPLEYFLYEPDDDLIIHSAIAILCILLVFIEGTNKTYLVLRIFTTSVLLISIYMVTQWAFLIEEYLIFAISGAVLMSIGANLLPARAIKTDL